jgi:hypothetical protein
MKTHIRTIHEETFTDNSKTLGVLLNFDDNNEFKESFIYLFNHKSEMYVFFYTMTDMYEYMLYAEKRVKRAYMEESDFDQYYDAESIEGKFTDILTWV